MFANEILIKDTFKLIHVDQIDTQELFDLVKKNQNYLAAWMPWAETTNSIKDTKDFVKSVREMILKDGIPNYGIYDNTKLIGMIGLNKKDSLNNIANVGYWISLEHQGKGIVSRALKLLIDLVFQETTINRIELYAGVGNLKSQKIAQHSGFVKEGIKRDAEKFKDGYHDNVNFSLLKSDWEKQNLNIST